MMQAFFSALHKGDANWSASVHPFALFKGVCLSCIYVLRVFSFLFFFALFLEIGFNLTRRTARSLRQQFHRDWAFQAHMAHPVLSTIYVGPKTHKQTKTLVLTTQIVYLVVIFMFCVEKSGNFLKKTNKNIAMMKMSSELKLLKL